MDTERFRNLLKIVGLARSRVKFEPWPIRDSNTCPFHCTPQCLPSSSDQFISVSRRTSSVSSMALKWKRSFLCSNSKPIHMSRKVEGKRQKGKKTTRLQIQRHISVFTNRLRDVVPWYFHLSIYKIGMLIFALPALLLQGWGSSSKINSPANDNYRLCTKTKTKLSEGSGEWAKASRHTEGESTVKRKVLNLVSLCMALSA